MIDFNPSNPLQNHGGITEPQREAVLARDRRMANAARFEKWQVGSKKIRLSDLGKTDAPQTLIEWVEHDQFTAEFLPELEVLGERYLHIVVARPDQRWWEWAD